MSLISWKIFLLFCIVMSVIGWTYKDKFNKVFATPNEHLSRPINDSLGQLPNAVILLTQIRSGSSFVGELFNQRRNTSYFYEPLFPFPNRPCHTLWQERVDVLRKMIHCDFNVYDHYMKGFKECSRTGTFVKYAQTIKQRCLNRGLCFTTVPKASRFLSRDAGICSVDIFGNQMCPVSFDKNALTRHCREISSLLALKVTYLCKLEWLVPLLRDTSVSLKVVHLVRDPRAIVSSRILSWTHLSRADWIRDSQNICEQQLGNVQFADDVMKAHGLRHKYMRVRHEDFSLAPYKTAQAVYDFLGVDMTTDVKDWLLAATSTKNSDRLSLANPQGTRRNPIKVVSSWRDKLRFHEVENIQSRCSKVMDLLGYEIFKSEAHLRNISSSPSFRSL